MKKRAATPPPAGKAPLREAQGVSVDPDEPGWRRLTGENSRRDLPPHRAARMREVAYYLWRTNPLANRVIELQLAFILSDGVSLQVEDADGQGWLDAFWHDPINRMDTTLFEMVRELALYGELFWVAFVNAHSGHVRLGYLDPERVDRVVRDPDNGRQAIGVITKPDDQGRQKRYRVIINGVDDDLFMPSALQLRAGFADGDIFYFSINNVSNSGGHSDLLPLAEWIDGYDQFLFGEIDRALFLRAFVWDVTLSGATPEEIRRRAQEIAPPRPGGVRVHNDAEQWEAVTPGLQATDSTELGRLFRNHVLGGGTIPEHWFGGGGDINRSTGESMSDPTAKIFTVRQTLIKYFLEEVGGYVLRRCLAAQGREMPGLEDSQWRVRAVFPEMMVKDVAKYATALQQVVVAVAAAINAGLITHVLALRLIESVAVRLGVEFETAVELEKVLAEGGAAREQPLFRPSSPPGTVAS
ncbi:MAG: phage portal protein [Magnetococcus sp. MYC-9]